MTHLEAQAQWFPGKPGRANKLRGCFLTCALCVSACLAVLTLAFAADPKIDYIERFSTNQVLLHFDTDANHTYYLQYTDKLATTNGLKATNAVLTNWSNLYTAFNYPFPDHYVIPDYRTNKARCYRLMVTTP